MKKSNLKSLISILILISSLFSLFSISTNAATLTFGISRPGNNLGLVGWWTLDGNDTVWTSATAATTLDKSGYGSTGTLTSMNQATSPRRGKIGQGLYFDGVNDVVSITDPSSGILDFAAGVNSTYSVWFKSDTSTGGVVVNKGFAGNGPGYGSRVGVTVSCWMGFGSGANLEPAGGSVTPLKWHNLMCIRSGTTLTTYLDGVSVNSVTDERINDEVNGIVPFCFGQRGGAICDTQPFAGVIDDFRLYNRALLAPEITALLNIGSAKFGISPTKPLQSGLVGWWTMDGNDTVWTSATAATTLDKSGNGKTGTLTNMNQALAPVPGKTGQGLNFDGVDEYVTAGNVSSSVKTVSFWMKTTNTTKKIIDLNATATIETSGGTITANNFTSPTIYVNGAVSSTITANTWYHVAITTDTAINANAVDIGRISTGYFPGVIDDVRLYNRALSAGEITQLYNLGR